MHRTFRTTLLLLAISGMMSSLSSCTQPISDDSQADADEWVCGAYKGKPLYSGPRGGCYYYNSHGNKTYVDRSECDC